MDDARGVRIEALGNWLAGYQGRFVNIRRDPTGDLIGRFYQRARLSEVTADRSLALKVVTDVPRDVCSGVLALVELAPEPVGGWLGSSPDRRLRLTLRRGTSKARAKATLYEPVIDPEGLVQRVTYVGISETLPDALAKSWGEHESRPGRKPDGPKPPPVVVGEAFHRDPDRHVR